MMLGTIAAKFVLADYLPKTGEGTMLDSHLLCCEVISFVLLPTLLAIVVVVA